MKNWLKRNKPIWIGGLIGFIISFIYFLINPLIKFVHFYSPPGMFVTQGEAFAFLPMIIIISIFIGIGALMGLIIQKVRKR